MGDMKETKAQRMARRDADVKKRYDELREKKYQGVRVYNHEAILLMVGFEFYLSPVHINYIVNGYNKNKGNESLSETEETNGNQSALDFN